MLLQHSCFTDHLVSGDQIEMSKVSHGHTGAFAKNCRLNSAYGSKISKNHYTSKRTMGHAQ